MSRAVSINAKLTLIAFITILLTMVIVGTVDLHFDRNDAHEALVEELRVLSVIIGDVAARALQAEDPAHADADLAALQARTAITAACVFDASGRLFAQFRRRAGDIQCSFSGGDDALVTTPDYIHVMRVIEREGVRLGEVHIHSHLGGLEDRLKRIYMVLLATLAGALILVLQVSWRLQRWVTRPLVTLSEQVRAVANDKDYSVRAKRASNDELGVLVDAFNTMLETIESQNRSLIEANRTLERILEVRTAELNDAQDALLRKERLAMLGQLTGTVSHELRNPLGTIQASIDVLRERMKGCTADIEKPLERMVRNIRRCENIINELLDYSRGSPPHLQDVDVDGWLEEVVGSYAPDEWLPIELESRVGQVVEMDPDRMRRVVTNLVDNARNALMEMRADSHSPQIRVRGLCRDGRLWIEIADNGPGIGVDVQQHIFEPLFSTRAFGVGLGLPIVKQILEQHNGGIEVESQEGQGTTVRVWLPLQAKARAIAGNGRAED